MVGGKRTTGGNGPARGRAGAGHEGAGGGYWLYGRHAVRAACGNPERRVLRLLSAKDTPDFPSPRPPERVGQAELAAHLPKDAVHQGLAAQVAPLPERALADLGADDGGPVLVLDRVGEGRVAQLLSDQSWLWARGFDGGGPQSDLLRRLVHWLMKQPDLEEDSLTATVAGDRIEIARRSLAPIAGEVAMRAPDGTTQSVPLRPAGEGRAVATLTAPGPGLYRLDHADQSAIAVVGTANPLEMADVRATEAVLAPIAEATGGAVMWLGISGIPDLRRVRADARRHGHDWIGLLANRQYLVSGLNQVPLLPAALLLALLIGGLMLAWRREGR